MQKEGNIYTFKHNGIEYSFNMIESIHQTDSAAVIKSPWKWRICRREMPCLRKNAKDSSENEKHCRFGWAESSADKQGPKKQISNIGAIFKALSQSLRAQLLFGIWIASQNHINLSQKKLGKCKVIAAASVAQKEGKIFTFVHDGNEFSFNIIESIHQNDSTAVDKSSWKCSNKKMCSHSPVANFAHSKTVTGIINFEDAVMRIDVTDVTPTDMRLKLVVAKRKIGGHMNRLNYLM